MDNISNSFLIQRSWWIDICKYPTFSFFLFLESPSSSLSSFLKKVIQLGCKKFHFSTKALAFFSTLYTCNIKYYIIIVCTRILSVNCMNERKCFLSLEFRIKIDAQFIHSSLFSLYFSCIISRCGIDSRTADRWIKVLRKWSVEIDVIGHQSNMTFCSMPQRGKMAEYAIRLTTKNNWKKKWIFKDRSKTTLKGINFMLW